MTAYNHKINQAALLTTQIHHSYNEYAKKFNLNYNELIVLYSLVTQKTCTQKQIGAIRELPKQTVHNICRKWIVDGFIQIIDHAEDKREKYLTLTPTGQAFAFPIIEPLIKLENQVVAQFTDENMDKFLAYFSDIQSIISTHIGAK